MADTPPSIRSVDAVVGHRTPSKGGTRFAQAVDQVAGIKGPVSLALAQARDPHAIARLMASMQESKTQVDLLQDRLRRTGDASLAPLIALKMQELDFRSTLVAKALGKVGSTVKEVATAA